MSVQSLKTAFENFQDRDGSPLENGYIYIGTAGLDAVTNAKTVYWDAAKTSAVSQPVRTSGGYPLNGGAIGEIYISDDYSVAIKDKNQALVYSNTSGNNETTEVLNYSAGIAGAADRSLTARLKDAISTKDFGCVGDGTTDDTVAFQAAMTYMATNLKPLEIIGNIAIYSNVTVSSSYFCIFGSAPSSSSVVMFNTAGIENNVAGNIVSGLVSGISFTDGDASGTAAWKTTPLLRLTGAFKCEFSNNTFIGNDNRRYGLKVGDQGRPCWGTRFLGNQFGYCQIGVMIGTSSDQTHIVFINNTVDHNKVCGAVFANLEGGNITGNSFELNEGKTALAVLSSAFGSSSVARTFTIKNNYCLFNCGNFAANAESIPFKIGVAVPDTDFTTPTVDDFTSGECQNFEISYNFIGGTDQSRAIAAGCFRSFSILNNLLSKNAGSAQEIVLTGATGLGEIGGNLNPDTGAGAAVLNSGTGSYGVPFRVNGGDFGDINSGKGALDFAVAGVSVRGIGLVEVTRAEVCMGLNRTATDGDLVQFFQDGTKEGSISVSGTTVSYNGAHLSRWSQLEGDRIEILRGSILSSLDEMCVWADEDNEQLNKMEVSTVVSDKNVAGVFQAWDEDSEDFYCAMTGDFIVRVSSSETVVRGDLLESNGDGTARVQADDIVRSSTVAKVSSNVKSMTYTDGSYCVPCVLMVC